jgi:hypothetical protein
MRELILIGVWSVEMTAMIARALGDGSRIVVMDAPPERLVDDLSRDRLDLLKPFDIDRLLGRYDVEPCAVSAEPFERHSEAGNLRREHHWREKQTRSMINARMKAQRRK